MNKYVVEFNIDIDDGQTYLTGIANATLSFIPQPGMYLGTGPVEVLNCRWLGDNRFKVQCKPLGCYDPIQKTKLYEDISELKRLVLATSPPLGPIWEHRTWEFKPQS